MKSGCNHNIFSNLAEFKIYEEELANNLKKCYNSLGIQN
jgi:hypothetical protein